MASLIARPCTKWFIFMKEDIYEYQWEIATNLDGLREKLCLL